MQPNEIETNYHPIETSNEQAQGWQSAAAEAWSAADNQNSRIVDREPSLPPIALDGMENVADRSANERPQGGQRIGERPSGPNPEDRQEIDAGPADEKGQIRDRPTGPRPEDRQEIDAGPPDEKGQIRDRPSGPRPEDRQEIDAGPPDEKGRIGDRPGRIRPEDIHSIGDRIEDWAKIQSLRTKDGSAMLPTGDILVRINGEQTMYMPNGAELKIQPDGDYSLKTKEPCKITEDNGVKTITFANGDQVKFDDKGVLSVQRDGKTVNFEPPIKLPPIKLPHQTFEQEAKTLLPTIDADGDGIMSKDELREATEGGDLTEREKQLVQKMETEFDKLRKVSDDKNDKGISASDLDKLGQERAKVEQQRQGSQNVEKMAGSPEGFARIDSNGNDYVSKQELTEALAKDNLTEQGRATLQFMLDNFNDIKKASMDQGFPNGISLKDVQAYADKVQNSKTASLIESVDARTSLPPIVIEDADRHQDPALWSEMEAA